MVTGEADIGYTNIILNYMESVIDNGSLLAILLSSVVDEDIKVPEGLIKNMTEFYKLIMEEV